MWLKSHKIISLSNMAEVKQRDVPWIGRVGIAEAAIGCASKILSNEARSDHVQLDTSCIV